MQEIRWKEPQISSELEKQHALKERPQRMREFLYRLLFHFGILAVFFVIAQLLHFHFTGKTNVKWDFLYLPLTFTFMIITPDVFLARAGTPHFAGECRVNKFGITNLGSGQNISWKDIADYHFESCENAPDLRVLIVEKRGRKAPLRLYFEGSTFEAHLRDVMTQGAASTRKQISQGNTVII